jgi:hypothetical protein
MKKLEKKRLMGTIQYKLLSWPFVEHQKQTDNNFKNIKEGQK